MKAVIIIIIFACALGLFFYLQKGDETETGGKAPKVDLDNLTVTPGVGIGPVKFGMSKDEVIKLLGKPDKEYGLVFDYVSNGFGIVFSESSGGVNSITCVGKSSGSEGFKGSTDKGIQMGATEEQIYAAYGKPLKDVRRGGGVSLFYTNPRIHFALVQDKLNTITCAKSPE